MARIVVRELEPLEILFNDKVLTCLLNNDAIMFLTEKFGDVNKLMEKEQDKPFDLAAKLLYCGVKLGDSSFTYDEARRITLSGGINLVSALMESFVEAFKVNATDEELEAYAGGDPADTQEIDWEMLYYLYCIEMGRPHNEFIESSLAKVLTMIDIHSQFKAGKITRGIEQKKKTTRQILGL